MLRPLALSYGECRTTSSGREARESHKTQEPSWRLGMNLKPLGDRLIVSPLDEEQTTSAGIVLPDTALERPQRGTVVAVGPGERSRETGEVIAMDIEEGDVVVYSKYGGTEIKVEGDEFLILRESDVLAKVVGDRQPAGAKA